MAPNLTSGTFRVLSLIDDEYPLPVGVNHTRPAFQSVHLNGPVATWVVEREGDNTYRLSVGGYRYTGVIDDRVIASVHPRQNVEWIATYREFHDAYTISPINDDIMGWTVAYDNPNSRVTLQPIRSTRSIPPQFNPAQLFRFEEIYE